MKERIRFFKAFLRNPRQVGALAQTSPSVAKEIAKYIDFQNAKCIVELGSGMGNITQKIVAKMPADCTLFCFEIDAHLCKQLQKNIRDERVKIIQDSAENLGRYLEQFGFEKADHIISTIPLSPIPYGIIKKILGSAFQYLMPGGKFIQIQYSLLGRKYIQMLFPEMSISFVPLNFPPAFVYVCVKM